MRTSAIYLFVALAAAQSSSTTTLSEISYVYTATSTVTHWEFTTTTTCPCPSGSTSSSSFFVDPALTFSTRTTTTTSTTTTSTTSTSRFTSSSTSTTQTPLVPGGVFVTSTSSISTPPSQPTTSSSVVGTSSTTSAGSGSDPVVTSSAYITALLQNHNAHRYNHSAAFLNWSPSLADTARKIAQTCVYGHVTTVDGGGYGQNIGAGFTADPAQMRRFITQSMYNGEVAAYTAYGSEPNINDLHLWGHFTQIVWKGTASVGCYTQDCSATGLAGASGIPPYFTVCNYSPPGNILTRFAANVGVSIGLPSVPEPYDVSQYIP